jgi:hypothetical protein
MSLAVLEAGVVVKSTPGAIRSAAISVWRFDIGVDWSGICKEQHQIQDDADDEKHVLDELHFAVSLLLSSLGC